MRQLAQSDAAALTPPWLKFAYVEEIFGFLALARLIGRLPAPALSPTKYARIPPTFLPQEARKR